MTSRPRSVLGPPNPRTSMLESPHTPESPQGDFAAARHPGANSFAGRPADGVSDENSLPEGWAWTTLGDLGEYINGRGFAKSEWSTNGRPIIRIQDLTGTGDTPNCFAGRVEEKYLVQPGDLLVSWAATLGAFIWHGPEGWLNQHIFKVRSHIDKLFHYYLIQSVLQDLYRQTHGSGMVHITRGKFDDTTVAVPPLAEQKRIVAAIEQQFTRLDAGVATLRRVQTALKRYRAAVLKAAVEGKLTEAWRADHPDVEPASALLARILAERRVRWEADLRAKGKDPAKARYEEPVAPDTVNLPELQGGWCWTTLGQLVARSEYGTSVKCSEEATGSPVLRIPNIAAGEIDLSDMKYATQPLRVDEESALQPGDILVCRTNGSVNLIGKAAVVRALLRPLHTFASYLLRFRLAEPSMLPRWLHLYLGSPQGRAFIERNAASSAGQHNISLSLLHTLPFPMPSTVEQKAIVAEVERRLSVVGELEANVEANLKRAERLRQSILERAFSGQLVPQNLNDEPASVLLERIGRAREYDRSASAGLQRRLATGQGEREAEGVGAAAPQQVSMWDDA